MVAKVAAVAIAFCVGMVLTSTPSHASTQRSVSSTKGKVIIMAGPPVCCGVTLS